MEKNNLKISIITASYNYATLIRETIDSVLSQTYSNWEMIIVDDGSCDNSVEVIKEYCAKDSRIKLFQHQNGENKGLKETLKAGILHSNGEFIAFLESDDLWDKNYLAEKVQIANQNNSAQVIFNDVELFGDKDRIDDYIYYFDKNRQILNKKKYPCNLFNALSFQNVIPTFSCAMVKTELIKNKDYESTVSGFLDHWMWAHLAANNAFYYIDKKLTKWRMHKNSYIGRSGNTNEKMFMHDLWQSLSKLHLSPIRMFFWNRHKFPKIEKLFRGFFRKFV